MTSSGNKMICPSCGVEMNHHCDKLVYANDAQETAQMDPDLGGLRVSQLSRVWRRGFSSRVVGAGRFCTSKFIDISPCGNNPEISAVYSSLRAVFQEGGKVPKGGRPGPSAAELSPLHAAVNTEVQFSSKGSCHSPVHA